MLGLKEVVMLFAVDRAKDHHLKPDLEGKRKTEKGWREGKINMKAVYAIYL